MSILNKKPIKTKVNCPPNIVSDPLVCFGKPRIERTGISVEAVVDRFIAGEPIGELADDYNITLDQILAAIHYQLKVKLDLDDMQNIILELSESNKIWEKPEWEQVNFFVVALNGEAGELSNKWKKILRGDFPIDNDDMAEEAADVLMYSLLLMSALRRGAKISVLKKVEIVRARLAAGGFDKRPEEKVGD